MLKKTEFLPIGTVVRLKITDVELMIIQRAIMHDHKLVDYAAVEYPRGMVGLDFIYFEKDQIAKVISTGYESTENSDLVKTLQQKQKDF